MTFFLNIFLSESPLKNPGGVLKEKCASHGEACEPLNQKLRKIQYFDKARL
jgi:hypothetical protein